MFKLGSDVPQKGGKGENRSEKIWPYTDFFETMCEKDHTFVQKCVTPELLAKVFTASILATSRYRQTI